MRHLKMLKDIDKLVNNDFCADMEMKTLDSTYTQKEAEEMAHIIASVYSISHCIHCKSCATRYK